MHISKPSVFLCHASPDKPTVREIYSMLETEGYAPWLDEESLVGGQDWKYTIERAIGQSDFFLACLSESAVDRRGFFQKEIRLALEVLDEMPEDSVYLIPIRLEPCRVPNRLRSNHWIDYYKPNFRENLLRALSSDGAPVAQLRSPQPGDVGDHAHSASTRARKSDHTLEVRVVIDYFKLVELLRDAKWAEAAYETLSLCVAASGRRTRSLNLTWNYGYFEGMTTGAYIPSIHLRKLSDLWAHTGRKCILPIAHNFESEVAFRSQIGYVNKRCSECGLPPLMIEGRDEDLEEKTEST